MAVTGTFLADLDAIADVDGLDLLFIEDVSDGSSTAKNVTVDTLGDYLFSNLTLSDYWTMDDMPDGPYYGKVLATDISSGHILLSEAVGTIDDLADGTVYGRVKQTSISAGEILLSEGIGTLDDIADGATYSKVAASALTAGGLVILSQTSGDLGDISGTLDDIADGTYGKVLATNISAGVVTLVNGTANAEAGTGQAIKLDATDGTLKLYDTSSNLVVKIDDNMYGLRPGIDVGNSTAGIGGSVRVFSSDGNFSALAQDSLLISTSTGSSDGSISIFHQNDGATGPFLYFQEGNGGSSYWGEYFKINRNYSLSSSAGASFGGPVVVSTPTLATHAATKLYVDSLLVTDHGALSGLTDDDHSLYLTTGRHDLTTRHTLGSVVPHDSHANLTGKGINDHHNKSHSVTDTANHTHSGSSGDCLLINGSGVMAWGNYSFSDLINKPSHKSITYCTNVNFGSYVATYETTDVYYV